MKARWSDTLFAIFHLLLLLGVLAYGVVSLFERNVVRFLLIVGCLALYYFLALHKNVKKEIARKKKSSSRKPR
ncbi:MAG: hypothetical protein ACE5LV_07310 [Candidatus Aminicenantales bacterium]